MKEEKKHIGNIFKAKLQNHKSPLEDQEWDNIAIKLNRMRFLNFSFFHFNIYYSILITGCFLLSSASFIKSFFYDEQKTYTIDEKNIPTTKNSTPYSIDSSLTNKTVNTPSNNNSLYKKKDNSSLQKTESDTKPNTIAPALALQKDTLKSTDTTSNKITPPEVKKKKKIVHIIKQDTIVIDETPIKKVNKRK